ncbi:MAG: DNA replication/repair protein RecF [Rhodospirillales bacterium 20-60-12]|nr:MAG: DNA replication/repair protein RecF [Rhodospirillales bacterium 20-60-12]HQT68124.1 DNA replication/repair protein RecF [Acetobacteraceae bacterium]HQU02118.1 DNA replication/repair protein RecF [Acetobacteraceae bacterium]
MRLEWLSLTEFRSYRLLRLTFSHRMSVFVGPNGSGKTNLLEAASLLTPGRGLRGARLADLQRHDAPAHWAVAGRVSGRDLGTGASVSARVGGGERRAFYVDGEPVRGQASFASLFACTWLTPQMDRLFTEGAAGRRRFLDRLVLALEPGHAKEVASFEAAALNRNRRLAEGHFDPAWLSTIEDAMARHAVAMTASRRVLIRQLNEAMAGQAAAPFPHVKLSLDCPIAARLAQAPALAVEDWLRQNLAAARTRLTPMISPQRADLMLHDGTTGRPAGVSSTGQQKAMLIGVILGHAALIARMRQLSPVLLLDEPLTHLDEAHRHALFACLSAGRAQVLLTGTDNDVFAPLRGTAAFYEVGEDRVALQS